MLTNDTRKHIIKNNHPNHNQTERCTAIDLTRRNVIRPWVSQGPAVQYPKYPNNSCISFAVRIGGKDCQWDYHRCALHNHLFKVFSVAHRMKTRWPCPASGHSLVHLRLDPMGQQMRKPKLKRIRTATSRTELPPRCGIEKACITNHEHLPNAKSQTQMGSFRECNSIGVSARVWPMALLFIHRCEALDLKKRAIHSACKALCITM